MKKKKASYMKNKEFKTWLLSHYYINLDLENHYKNDIKKDMVNLSKTYEFYLCGKPKLVMK